jgi:hypothetical protein
MKQVALAAAFALLCQPVFAASKRPATIDGVTFNDQPGTLYLPARDVSRALGWRLNMGNDHKTLYLNKKAVHSRTRELPNGTLLVQLAELKHRGLAMSASQHGKLTLVRIKTREFYAREGAKRVVVNKSHMQIRAWQGQRVVMASPVTLGVEGKDTPTGLFKADGNREKMHKSALYHDAPMPWSVHVVGNVFIHGWPHVSGGRGSHGCIRLPVSGGNPARFMYYWIDKGTPVSILGKWPRGAKG